MVALDLDGTLVDQAAAARIWAAEFVRTHDLDLDGAQLGLMLTERRPKGEVFTDLVRASKLPLTSDALWTEYRKRMPELVTCTDQDRNALVRLRDAGWALGIVTNGMVDNQEGKIRSLGLDALVDGWVVSSEIGVRKPAPEIFQTLADRLGCPLEGWMVGDSLDHDVAGGAAVGLSTAWITDSNTEPTGVQPSCMVESVAEAAAIILSQV